MMKLKWSGCAAAILIPRPVLGWYSRCADGYGPSRRIIHLQGRDAGAKHQPRGSDRLPARLLARQVRRLEEIRRGGARKANRCFRQAMPRTARRIMPQMSWQSSKNNDNRPARSLRRRVLLPATVMLAGSLVAAAADEPCNPIIDGTYCATNMPKNRGYVRSSGGMTPLEDYSRLVPLLR